MPITGVFSPNLVGIDIIGTSILGFWCIYFMPVCILAYLYFKNM
jgi:hypothetical protein